MSLRDVATSHRQSRVSLVKGCLHPGMMTEKYFPTLHSPGPPLLCWPKTAPLQPLLCLPRSCLMCVNVQLLNISFGQLPVDWILGVMVHRECRSFLGVSLEDSYVPHTGIASGRSSVQKSGHHGCKSGMKGTWSLALRHSVINFLELLAVFLSLQCFLLFLRSHRVLVRTDNTSGQHSSQSDIELSEQGYFTSWHMCLMTHI